MTERAKPTVSKADRMVDLIYSVCILNLIVATATLVMVLWQIA